jgi:hypothetical protein
MYNTIAKVDATKSNIERNKNGNWKETLAILLCTTQCKTL